MNVTLDNTPIEVLNLSLRPYNVLKRAGINTIGQLTIKSDRELLKVKNLSLKCIEEIHKALEEYEEVITNDDQQK